MPRVQTSAGGSFDKGNKIRRIETTLDSPTPILKQVGAMMVGESARAFNSKRLGNIVWKKRMNPNWPAMIADFHAGKPSAPERRWQDSDTLVDEGTFRNSIAFELVDKKTVSVGSGVGGKQKVPYGGALHAGKPTETKPFTKAVRKRFYKWYKRLSKDRQRLIGWLLNKKFINKTWTIKHPARPVVGLTPDLRKRIKVAIGVTVKEV